MKAPEKEEEKPINKGKGKSEHKKEKGVRRRMMG